VQLILAEINASGNVVNKAVHNAEDIYNDCLEFHGAKIRQKIESKFTHFPPKNTHFPPFFCV